MISRELRRRSALTVMGHAPSAYSEHTPRYRGVNQVLGTVQTSQWLEAHMKTCTLSESQTTRAVAKSSQQGGHSEHETVAPKSQRASSCRLQACVQNLCAGGHQEARQAAYSQQKSGKIREAARDREQAVGDRSLRRLGQRACRRSLSTCAFTTTSQGRGDLAGSSSRA